VRNDEVAFGAKPTSMGGQGWVAQSRLTPTGRSANPARIRLSDGHAAMTMTTRAVIAEGNFIVAGSAAIQKPHSLYCFVARRNREPIWTKSTSRHSFPRRFSPRPFHRRYSRFIRQRFSRGSGREFAGKQERRGQQKDADYHSALPLTTIPPKYISCLIEGGLRPHKAGNPVRNDLKT
jgi:hypothetical protein